MPRGISAYFALYFLLEDANVHRILHAGSLSNTNSWVDCCN